MLVCVVVFSGMFVGMYAAVSREIKEMIMKNATTAEIKRTAIAAGMHTLHRSAAEQVVKGITSIEEMRRVSTES